MGAHYVYFSDDLGIASVFPGLKNKLVEPGPNHFSLFYYSSGSRHQFQRELEILRMHYPTSLWVSYFSKDALSGTGIGQHEIEALLNANTMQKIMAIISGNEDFTHNVREVLLFLGIENVQIQQQYFTE